MEKNLLISLFPIIVSEANSYFEKDCFTTQ